MQNTRMKKHWTSFMALALLFFFAFVSCGKSDPDNTGTEKQEETEAPQEPQGNSDPERCLIVYYSYTGHCEEIVAALSSHLEADVLRIREADAKRLLPDGKFYASSLWINHQNHSNRARLVKEWLEKNKI